MTKPQPKPKPQPTPKPTPADRTALNIVFFAGKQLYGAKLAVTALKPSKN